MGGGGGHLHRRSGEEGAARRTGCAHQPHPEVIESSGVGSWSHSIFTEPRVARSKILREAPARAAQVRKMCSLAMHESFARRSRGTPLKFLRGEGRGPSSCSEFCVCVASQRTSPLRGGPVGHCFFAALGTRPGRCQIACGIPARKAQVHSASLRSLAESCVGDGQCA